MIYYWIITYCLRLRKGHIFAMNPRRMCVANAFVVIVSQNGEVDKTFGDERTVADAIIFEIMEGALRFANP